MVDSSGSATAKPIDLTRLGDAIFKDLGSLGRMFLPKDATSFIERNAPTVANTVNQFSAGSVIAEALGADSLSGLAKREVGIQLAFAGLDLVKRIFPRIGGRATVQEEAETQTQTPTTPDRTWKFSLSDTQRRHYMNHLDEVEDGAKSFKIKLDGVKEVGSEIHVSVSGPPDRRVAFQRWLEQDFPKLVGRGR